MVTSVSISEDPRIYEETHVHAVYEEIAPHFSSTRYKVNQVTSRTPLSTNAHPAVARNSGLPDKSPGRMDRSWFWYRKRKVSTTSDWKTQSRLDDWHRSKHEPSQNCEKCWRSSEGSCTRQCFGSSLAGGRVCSCILRWLFVLLNIFQDYTISIATIHHMATYERRKQAVQVGNSPTSFFILFLFFHF